MGDSGRSNHKAQWMKAVADTNTVVSGLLWHGAPHRVLDAARMGRVELFTTAVLLAELEDVLYREKFAQRLAQIDLAPPIWYWDMPRLPQSLSPPRSTPSFSMTPMMMPFWPVQSPSALR